MTYDEEEALKEAERLQKTIIVSIVFRGKTHWRQMSARKDGKRYVVDANSLNEWLDDIGIQMGQTWTLG